MSFYIKQTAGRADKALGGFLRIRGVAGILVGILCFAISRSPVLALTAPAPDPSIYSLTLTWDSSPSPEVVGYHLYYGAESGNYTNGIVTSNVTTMTVSGLSLGVTYFFALTAFAADGQESDFSNEVSYRRDPLTAQMQIHSVSNGQFMLTVTGPAGHTYDIEATEDLSAWTVIGTVTVDASGSFDFTDTNAADFSQRFYRTRDTQP